MPTPTFNSPTHPVGGSDNDDEHTEASFINNNNNNNADDKNASSYISPSDVTSTIANANNGTAAAAAAVDSVSSNEPIPNSPTSPLQPRVLRYPHSIIINNQKELCQELALIGANLLHGDDHNNSTQQNQAMYLDVCAELMKSSNELSDAINENGTNNNNKKRAKRQSLGGDAVSSHEPNNINDIDRDFKRFSSSLTLLQGHINEGNNLRSDYAQLMQEVDILRDTIDQKDGIINSLNSAIEAVNLSGDRVDGVVRDGEMIYETDALRQDVDVLETRLKSMSIQNNMLNLTN